MTLTQTAILTKQIIIISVIAFVLGISGFIGYNIWHAYYLAHLPPVEEKPDIKFGLLPLPDFPKGNVSTSNFTYSLDTATGGLPKIGVDLGFEKITKVYFVNQTFATLLSPDRSLSLAEKFGIASPPGILTETEYKFKDVYKNLLIDLNTGNFSYQNEATLSAKPILDEDNKLVSDFKQILSSFGLSKEDLAKVRSRIIYLKIAGNQFIPTELKLEAQAAQISLWPDPFDKKSIFTPDYSTALINAIVINSADKIDNYRSLNFTNYSIDTSIFATYPAKTLETAFEDLKNNKGTVVMEPNSPKVSITSISNGYYLSNNYNPYLQPIYVFEGPSFVAYVSAIREDFQSKATEN